MQPHHEGIGTVSFTPIPFCTWPQQPKTYSRVTFPLILLSLAPTCRGCRKCQDSELSSQGGSLMSWQSAEAKKGIPGAPGTCQSLGSHPGCKGAVASWSDSLWEAEGNHQPCKHQVSILDCPASPTGNIHTAKSQEQHQNPLANTNKIMYLLASSSKRQGKKDVKNMINLTGPKQ